MACERYRDALTDVAAGEPATAAVEAHLASCEACRAELQVLRRALAVADTEMAGLLAAEPSPELAARIRQAVAEEDPSQQWRFGWLWPAVAAAVTLLVALAAVMGRGTPSAPESSMAVDAHGPQSAGGTRAMEPVGEPLAHVDRPVPAADGNDLVTPRRPGQAERRGAGRPDGSPGTRQAGVPRDDRAPEPEVLVPAGETEALLRFTAHLRTRVVSPDSLLLADLSAPLPEPKGVEIQPLAIVPLDPAETSGTD
jgi:hypothetical protein